MALYPKATKQLLTVSKGRQKMSAYNRVNVHVAASNAGSLYTYFNKSSNPDSHFYVLKDGSVIQYVDTAYRANADLEGNDATISIETQGGASKANSEKLTDAQVEAIAEIFAWSVQTHGVPNKKATTSQIGSTSHGLSWHRLGIDGNFPELPSVLAGRIQRGGGMYYSKSRGKVCPGDEKIKQIATIFKKAQDLIVTHTGGTVEPGSGASTVTPVTGKIATDGWWGPATTGLAQKISGLKVDKVVSQQWKGDKVKNLGTGWEWVAYPKGGSNLIKHLQKVYKAKGWYSGDIDGFAGPKFWKAIKKGNGGLTHAAAIKKFQVNLNAGRLHKK